MFVRGVPSKERFNACRLMLPKRGLLNENALDTIANESHAVNRLKERGYTLPLSVFFRPNHSMIGFGEGNHYTGFSLIKEQVVSDQCRSDIKSLFQLDGLSVALEARACLYPRFGRVP
ncbi:hypothetical protein Rcae01_00946 [Novipirellula caenicola]|uniref:Uncharacterized protein n=1 Tax=Novipirellula caenicola TaxID=1536901 RepID=A0ABP9VJX1_9BACT